MQLPFHQSPNYYRGRSQSLRIIVVHSVESDISAGIAGSLAGPNWFGSTRAGTSAHAIFDPSGGWEMVKPGDTAWHVGNANSWTYGIEHAGRAAMTRADWMTTAGQTELRLSALWARQIADQFGIPHRWLTVSEMVAGAKGFATHNDCRLAFGGTTHTDPGPGFPKDYYMQCVDGGVVQEDEDDVTPDDIEKIAQRTRQVIADGTNRYGLDALRARIAEVKDAVADAKDYEKTVSLRGALAVVDAQPNTEFKAEELTGLAGKTVRDVVKEEIAAAIPAIVAALRAAK